MAVNTRFVQVYIFLAMVCHEVSMSKLVTVVRLSGSTGEEGVSLTSSMVATALMALVAVAVMKLFSNYQQATGTLGLMEKRATILKHYGEVLVSGWDNTKQQNSTLTGAIAVYGRDNTTPVIPQTGLYLSRDLYTADTAANGWWKVSATGATLTGAPIDATTATLIGVTLKVSFDHDKHPDLKTRLSEREQVVFFHHNIRDTHTDCSTDNANKVMIQYDFISNFTRCSTWPLVKISQSTGCADALIGFDPLEFTAAKKYQLHTKYGGIAIKPRSCGTTGYITAVSSCGDITCDPVRSTVTPCSSWLNEIGASGGTNCIPGPEGPMGPDGSLITEDVLVTSCPTTCLNGNPVHDHGKQYPP